jgi:hypothetical protein
MAGSPLKRARKQGARLDDGRIIAFPYMPRVADLPSGRRHFSAAEKIEHLIGLDRCYEILSWPSAGLDRVRLSMKAQVVRIILIIAGRRCSTVSRTAKLRASVSVARRWRG